MTCQIHIPTDMKPMPSSEEMSVARIVADYFNADVSFIKRNNTTKTADLKVRNTVWEIKSPTGKGKHNIQHKLQDAALQSKNVILDGRMSKIHSLKLKREVIYQFYTIRKLKRLIFINKAGKPLEIIKEK